ncbi:NAD(P)/FAD-dependent oxidoreductase [Phreatobacter aquaticus]|uniref:NAD(P)/FAD-dependent oxidoreductase n=1 Tax=Phreatobacter aquaticus TaxID=2570229 RepID=A0A4D7QRE5_9HYPH|nr:NAD(P)/FAD-dependent oxidoreductase [Phreatobacter aquaticus]QCK88156.1 NAD(P)/FAD-dependent oxidoreductase [Phreatobacter aquaticus]
MGLLSHRPPQTVHPHAASLAELEARLAYDLSCLNYPPPNWVPPTPAPDGGLASDVVVIGGGMSGLTAAVALVRSGVRNIRILDASPAGEEGPWVTYARMETLRSPKELLGPALGMPSLTFRAWYEAQFGEASWAALYRIPRTMWMEYLNWFRKVLAVPVENGVEVTAILPEAGLFRLDLANGSPIFARKVVLATGRAGLGRAAIPDFVAGVDRRLWAHSADPIDFEQLRGKRVVVIGGGASAMDNAAEALEHGAAEVRLLIRRAEMPRINKMMGIGSQGFTLGFPVMSDAWRWRFMRYADQEQTPAPQNSTLRVSRHGNASFHLGSGIAALRENDGQLEIETTRGRHFTADLLILGTGFTVEIDVRPELAAFSAAIAAWRDRYSPPPGLESSSLAGFPYLTPSFAFTEREPGKAPFLADLHCFNHAATLSLGKISGDIPKISEGATLLAQAVAGELFCRDIERHWQALNAYDKPELVGDEWTDAEALGAG